MAEVQGCELPEDLYYDVEKDTWAKPLENNVVMLGMTDVAQTQAEKFCTLLLKKQEASSKKGETLQR